MAWTAGVTRTTADLISAADWNSYLGAAGSLDYLKTETEKLDDCSHAEPARALDTIYQNSTKIRIVTISIQIPDSASMYVYIEDVTPPTTLIVKTYHGNLASIYMPLTFVVPSSWYYKAQIEGGIPAILEWHEWDLH